MAAIKKDLNISNTNKLYPMQKRGQAEAVIGVILLVGVVLGGAIGSYNALNDNRYVLDISTNKVYDLAKCSINHLDSSNLRYIQYGDVKNAQKNYKMAECN